VFKETCSKVLIDNHLSDSFLIQNGLQQGDVLSALLFNLALKCALRKVQENQVGLKLNGNHQLVTFADDVSKDIKIRIYKIIILLPMVLYGCETWSLILRTEHGLRVFENRVLRSILGPKREGVKGGWRKLHDEELCDLYSSPSIIRMDKSRKMR
jgi:hypothetical protein